MYSCSTGWIVMGRIHSNATRIMYVREQMLHLSSYRLKVPAFSNCHSPQCIAYISPDRCRCSQCTTKCACYNTNGADDDGAGNTGVVRPVLRLTTHGTDSDRLIDRADSKEPGQGSITSAGFRAASKV